MKATYRYLAVALLGIVIAGTTSCKKKDNDSSNNPLPDNDTVSRIIMISSTDPTVISATSISYKNGRASKVEYSSGSASTYIYNGNEVTITYTQPNGAVRHISTVTLNSFGLVEHFVRTVPGTGEVLEEYGFTYDASGQVRGYTLMDGSGNVFPGFYRFTNGDMTFVGDGVDSSIYIYDVNQPLVKTDPSNFNDLLYMGAYNHIDKHQLRSYVDQFHDTTDYSYQYDNSGRVSLITATKRHGAVYSTSYKYKN